MLERGTTTNDPGNRAHPASPATVSDGVRPSFVLRRVQVIRTRCSYLTHEYDQEARRNLQL